MHWLYVDFILAFTNCTWWCALIVRRVHPYILSRLNKRYHPERPHNCSVLWKASRNMKRLTFMNTQIHTHTIAPDEKDQLSITAVRRPYLRNGDQQTWTATQKMLHLFPGYRRKPCFHLLRTLMTVLSPENELLELPDQSGKPPPHTSQGVHLIPRCLGAIRCLWAKGYWRIFTPQFSEKYM